MSVIEGGGSSGLVQRVQDILLRPKPTWDVIDGETATVQGLFTKYICILAALPAISTVLGNLLLAPLLNNLVAYSLPGVIVLALLNYVGALIGCYVFAFVVDMLAPSFDGQKGLTQAMKGVAYGGTAAWVGGGLAFIPLLGWLAALAGGLYSLYLFYLGLPKMMKVPEAKALGFVVVSIIVVVVIQFAISAVVGSMVLMAGLGAAATGAAAGLLR